LESSFEPEILAEDNTLVQEEMDDSDIMVVDSSIQSGSSGKLSVAGDSIDLCTAENVDIKPNFDASYAEKLVIPTRFSMETSTAIETGLLKRKHRDEIVNSLSTLMLVHTSHPTPEDYTTICRRLVGKYPNLKDKVDSGYSSWRMKLRKKFKNLRRPSRSIKAGITLSPPTKKSKAMDNDKISSISSDDLNTYERNIEFIQRSFYSKKWSVSSMIVLLGETAKHRREWITSNSPAVKEVLEKFPCLADSQVMFKEFCNLCYIDEQEIKSKWDDIDRRLFKYASSIEDKKPVKKLIEQYQSIEHVDEDQKTMFVIQILTSILCRNHKRGCLLTVVKGETIDNDKAIKEIQIKAPSIIAFGVMDKIEEIKIIIEDDNVLRMPSMLSAVSYCISAYYVFNISYPPEFRSLMLFLEKYIYGLKPSLTLPLSATLLYDNLLHFNESQ
jgi:hypothetical protein